MNMCKDIASPPRHQAKEVFSKAGFGMMGRKAVDCAANLSLKIQVQ
jgi:hypothetical protein